MAIINHEVKKSSNHSEWRLACILSNCMMGISIVAMPRCFRQSGLLLSTLLLLLSCAICSYTCRSLIRCKRILKVKSYDAIAGALLGKHGQNFVQACVCLMLIGLIIAYQTTVRSLLTKTLNTEQKTNVIVQNHSIVQEDNVKDLPHLEHPVIQPKFDKLMTDAIYPMRYDLKHQTTTRWASFALFILTFASSYPLSLSGDVEKLGRISYLAIWLYGLLAIFICIHSTILLFNRRFLLSTSISFWKWDGVSTTLPIFILGMCCHPWVVTTLESSACGVQSVKAGHIIDMAITITASCYWTAGMFGCLCYLGSNVPGDYLITLDKNASKNIVELAFIATCLLSIPILLHPCKILICNKMKSNIKCILPLGSRFGRQYGRVDDAQTSTRITAFLLFITTTLAIMAPSIENILRIIGSILSSFIALIFPALFSMTLDGKQQQSQLTMNAHLANCLKFNCLDVLMIINGLLLVIMPICELF